MKCDAAEDRDVLDRKLIAATRRTLTFPRQQSVCAIGAMAYGSWRMMCDVCLCVGDSVCRREKLTGSDGSEAGISMKRRKKARNTL
ncbi:MAG: hypothetical protein JW736_09535 [Deltaproteobacteria bacterium]|nr:hypothetical protein [Deltaproteobacteria bacterium]